LSLAALCLLHCGESFFSLTEILDLFFGEIFDRLQPVSDTFKIALPEEFLRKTSVTLSHVMI
jgi:hypothetical protein